MWIRLTPHHVKCILLLWLMKSEEKFLSKLRDLIWDVERHVLSSKFVSLCKMHLQFLFSWWCRSEILSPDIQTPEEQLKDRYRHLWLVASGLKMGGCCLKCLIFSGRETFFCQEQCFLCRFVSFVHRFGNPDLIKLRLPVCCAEPCFLQPPSGAICRTHMMLKHPSFCVLQNNAMGGMPVPNSMAHVGLTYIRWGRRTCPNHLRNITRQVYEGLTAGSLSTQPGSGSNTLCLPLTPSWGNFSDLREAGAQIFGAEYRFGPAGGYNVFENTGMPGRLAQRKVPCSVCHTRMASSVLMVPASTLCPIGWQQQYRGYLMSERFDHHKSEYICVDADAEPAVLGSQLPREGLGLYPVEAGCGALPCGPYMQSRELTCTVCTI